jgi:hypothetical protein
MVGSQIVFTPLSEVAGRLKPIDLALLGLVRVMGR